MSSNETFYPLRSHVLAEYTLGHDELFEKLPLSEQETQSLLHFSEQLVRGNKLEQLLDNPADLESSDIRGIEAIRMDPKLNVISQVLYLEYLLTDEGQSQLSSALGRNDIIPFRTIDDATKFFASLDYKELTKEQRVALDGLTGAGKKFVTEKLAQQLVDGEDIDEIHNPTKKYLSIILIF